MQSQSPLLVCAALLSYTISTTLGSGVLTIRLTGFKNTFGRTYDGTCCDTSPKDHGSMCYDQCDYVMRLIVTGLGRANDHVFLFHRPLTYDSNNIVFENGDSNLLLTVLFDEWPEDDQVKMNAFFYDYDDFDHTTTLVDWFETDLRHSVNSTAGASVGWGNFQQQTVIGNRQTDKTVLTFEWSALNEKDDYIHLTTAKSKLTVAPAAEPTHMTRLSTSREATDLLRQAWANADVNSDTNVNFDEDLKTKVPGLLKSVFKSLRSRKERLPKRIMQDEKPMTINTNYGQYHKESDALGDGKFVSEQDLARSLNSNRYSRRRVGLLKIKPANSSMPTPQLFHGKIDSQNSLEEAERKFPAPKVSITTSSNSKFQVQQRNQKLQSETTASAESDDGSSHLDKPERFENRRPFIRPRSWFNSFSDKLTPVRLNERKQNYEGKHARKWNKSSGERVKDTTNQESTEDSYNDVYFNSLRSNDDSYIGNEFNSGKTAEKTYSQTYKDKIPNTPGNIAQHRPKSLIHRIRNPNTQNLKLNLTEELAPKFGNKLQETKIRNSDLITPGKFRNASRKKATKARIPSANKKHGTLQSVATDFQWEIAPVLLINSTATSVSPKSSKDYQISSSVDLKARNNKIFFKSLRTGNKLQRGKMTTNVTNQSVGINNKTSVTILRTKDSSKPIASNHIVVYKSNVTTNNNMAKDSSISKQNNRIKTDQTGNLDEDINASSSFTDHLVNTDQTYQRKQNASAVSVRKNAKDFPRKLQRWRKTTTARSDNTYVTLKANLKKGTTTIRPLQKLSTSVQPAERSGASYTPSSTAIAVYLSTEQRQRTQSHQSVTQVPKSELYTKIYMNAAAAIDRPRFSPPRKKGPQIVNNYGISEGSNLFNNSTQNVKIKLKVNVHTTPAFIRSISKDILAVGQAEAETKVATPSDRRVYKPQSDYLYSNEPPGATAVQIPITGAIGHYGTTGEALVDMKTPGLRSNHKIARKKTDARKLNEDFDINKTGVPQTYADNRFPSSALEGVIKSTRSHQQRSGVQTVNIQSNAEVASHDNYVEEKLHSAVLEKQGREAKPVTRMYNLENDIGKVRYTPNIEDNRLDTNDRQPQVKKYKINFTSLPELLEDETMTLPVMQDDQLEDGKGYYGEAERDNYAMDLNVPGRSNSHKEIRPKTPKPLTSGEIQYKSIKSLKAVRFETHAPVQWYVTAQSILRNAAINGVRPLKEASKKVTQDNIPAIRNNGNVDKKGNNGIVLTKISISDTKLRDSQADMILNAASINKVIDDSSGGDSQANEAFDQHVANDIYNKNQERKNGVILLQSPNSIRGRENNGDGPSLTLDKQLREYTKISNNPTSTRQPLKGSYNKSRFIKQDDSIPTDEKLHSTILQPTGHSNNIQENVDTSQIAQPPAFSVERKYNEMVKTNKSTQFSNFADELFKSKVDSVVHSLGQRTTGTSVDAQQVVDKILTPYKADNGEAVKGLKLNFINNSASNISATTKSDFPKLPYAKNLSNNTAAKGELFTNSSKTVNGAKAGTQSKADQTPRISPQNGAINATNNNDLSRSQHEPVLSGLISGVNFKDNEKQSQLSVGQIQSNGDTPQKSDKSLLGKQTMVDQESLHGKISILSINDKKGSPKTFQDKPIDITSISSDNLNNNAKIRTSYEDIKHSGQAYMQTKNTHSEKKPMTNNHVSATYNIKTANDASVKATSIGLLDSSKFDKAQDFQKEKTHKSLNVTNSKTKLPNINPISKLDNHIVNTNKMEQNTNKERISKHGPDKAETRNNALLKSDITDKNVVSIVALKDEAPNKQIQVASVNSLTETNKVIKGQRSGILYDGTNNLVNDKYDQPLVSKSDVLPSVVHDTKLTSDAKNVENSVLNKLNFKSNPSSDNMNEMTDKTIVNVSGDRHRPGANSHMILQKNSQIQLTVKTSNFANLTKNAVTKDAVSSKAYRENTFREIVIPQSKSTAKPPLFNVRMGATNSKTQSPAFSKSSPGRHATASPTKVTVETQLSAASNETMRDPFEMMSLFMAKQNLFEAMQKVQRKQTTTIPTLASKTLVSASTPVDNSTKLPIKITSVTAALTNKTRSSQPVTTLRTPPKDIPARNLTNDSGKTSVNDTKLKAGVQVKITKQGFVEEKNKTKSTVELVNKRNRTTESIRTTRRPLSSVSLTSTRTTTQSFRSTEKITRSSAVAKRLTEGTNTTSVHTNTRVKPTQISRIANTTLLPTTRLPIATSASVNVKHSKNGTAGTKYPNVKTTAVLNQINTNSKHRDHSDIKLPVLGPNFDKNGTKIVYSPGRPHSDETLTSKPLFSPVYFVQASMNTLPEHGFILHTQSFKDSAVKSNKKQPDGLPLPKLSRTENGVRRHSIYREMNLDKFRSYVNSIRNYPTVKVPYHGLYRPDDQTNGAIKGAEVPELPQPGRRYGTFYSSVSNVGAVFTRYWPAVLGVSVGTIFLVTALVTSILCRQRRLLIQRTRWSDSPQHVSEPPDTSEYTSSSEASLASDLTRSSIHLM